MDKSGIGKILLFRIPMSICNFRCHYCYLAQRESCYEGVQPVMRYSPEQVAYALRPERIGGRAYMNFCADGETLLTKNIEGYVKKLVEEGHYAEIVTNLSVTPVLERFLAWNEDLLKRIEFKCSLHYLELKNRGLLQQFADNVHKIWEHGASANIEITPNDELIPYIDEVIDYSQKEFGALPHLTIARDDTTKEIGYLTKLSMEEYDKIWSKFDSSFWAFKKSIFGKKQRGYCYAGYWSAYIDLSTGNMSACYGTGNMGNAFENPDIPFPECPVGRCRLAHCYNGHALLTLGLIPGVTDIRYGDIRDRDCINGENWLNSDLKAFFNTKLKDNKDELNIMQKTYFQMVNDRKRIIGKFKQLLEYLK